MKPLIYIAGPMSKGYLVDNIRKAIDIAEMVLVAGGVPIVPQLSTMWDMISPHPYQFWIDMDLDLLAHCNGLVRLSGESEGADVEVAAANEDELAIFYWKWQVADPVSLREWIKALPVEKARAA